MEQDILKYMDDIEKWLDAGEPINYVPCGSIKAVFQFYNKQNGINNDLLNALKKITHWAHWANEKLGFDLDPVFPEYIKAKEAIAKAEGIKQ